jgi:hypothetical protein
VKIETTHEFSENDKCVACGLMLKNVIKKPVCKVLMSTKPYKLKVPRGEKKRVAHKFKDGWCQHCDVRDFNEHKTPWCKMKYKTPVAAPGKGGKLGLACHNTHPVLKFGKLEIYGGSCGTPKVKDCDVYIGFDNMMSITRKSAPWRRGQKGFAEEVFHKVTDFKAPSDPAEFKRLVKWTLEQMEAGKKVHAGCIGGHGRTGTFFAAIAAMQNEIEIEDCVMYVREHYCKRSVENAEQIKFLTKHFGIKTKAKGSKSFSTGKKVKQYQSKYSSEDMLMADEDEIDALITAQEQVWNTTNPTPGAGNVWGHTLGEEDL